MICTVAALQFIYTNSEEEEEEEGEEMDIFFFRNSARSIGEGPAVIIGVRSTVQYYCSARGKESWQKYLCSKS